MELNVNIEGIISIDRFFELTNTCLILREDGKQGTGFFYKVRQKIYCVTNNHVMAQIDNFTIFYGRRISIQQNRENYEFDISLKCSRTINKIINHPNNKIDLCFILLDINDDVFTLTKK